VLAHAAYRKIIGGLYSLSSILKTEKGLDDVLKLLMQTDVMCRLKKRDLYAARLTVMAPGIVAVNECLA
jgi:hypothetical protein